MRTGDSELEVIRLSGQQVGNTPIAVATQRLGVAFNNLQVVAIRSLPNAEQVFKIGARIYTNTAAGGRNETKPNITCYRWYTGRRQAGRLAGSIDPLLALSVDGEL